MLSDITIRKLAAEGRIIIDPPPAEEAYQPASVDLRLGRSFITEAGQEVEIPRTGFNAVQLGPGECLLACTRECVGVPADIVARVEGKSSWGRCFLMIHSTAGFIDPGFHGQITLELKNLSKSVIALPLGAYIAQISFQYLDQPAGRPYGSKDLGSRYQGQRGATPARF
jgi:dCTP deaminase